MNCCGRQRAVATGERTSGAEEREPVWISYAGVGVVVVKGPATGHVYRFSPGNWRRVHGSDAPAMREIPGLRRREVSATPSLKL